MSLSKSLPLPEPPLPPRAMGVTVVSDSQGLQGWLGPRPSRGVLAFKVTTDQEVLYAPSMWSD